MTARTVGANPGDDRRRAAPAIGEDAPGQEFRLSLAERDPQDDRASVRQQLDIHPAQRFAAIHSNRFAERGTAVRGKRH